MSKVIGLFRFSFLADEESELVAFEEGFRVARCQFLVLCIISILIL